MAKTLNEFVYSVLEAVSGFFVNDDFQIPVLWVEDQLISQNHSLIRKARTERRIDEYLYLSDEKLEVKSFDNSFTVGDIEIKNRTDYCYAEIKPLVTGLRGQEIQTVANINYSIVFDRVNTQKIFRKKSDYYSLGNPSYAVYNDKLIFRSKDVHGIKYIVISGIFSDPRELSSWDPNNVFPTPSEKNLETLTIQHIDHALRHNPDLFNDGQRAYKPMAKANEQD